VRSLRPLPASPRHLRYARFARFGLFSWLLALSPLLLVAALTAASVGRATGLVLFSRVDWGVHVVSMFLLLTSTVSLSLACAACGTRPAVINVMSFCHFAAGAVVTVLLGVFNFYEFIYSPTFPPALFALGFFPWPFVHYGRFVSTALRKVLLDSGARFDWRAVHAAPPPVSVFVNGLPVTWTDRAPGNDLGMLAALTVIYILIAWYAGQVRGGGWGGRGSCTQARVRDPTRILKRGAESRILTPPRPPTLHTCPDRDRCSPARRGPRSPSTFRCCPATGGSPSRGAKAPA
jgi:hypothetical protein